MKIFHSSPCRLFLFAVTMLGGGFDANAAILSGPVNMADVWSPGRAASSVPPAHSGKTVIQGDRELPAVSMPLPWDDASLWAKPNVAAGNAAANEPGRERSLVEDYDAARVPLMFD